MQFGPGMAPTPRQLERLKGALQDSSVEEEEDLSVSEFPPRPRGMGSAPPLHKEITQIMWSVHWQYQKRILDHVQAASSSDRQWIILRRIMMEIMTEQLDKMQALVGQRIRQENYNKKDEQDGRFEQSVEPGRFS